MGNGVTILISDNKWFPFCCPLISREDATGACGVERVSGLFLPGLPRWNHELVEFISWPPSAMVNFQIPLPLTAREDVFYWPHTMDGEYTTKSSYAVARSKKVMTSSSSSSSH